MIRAGGPLPLAVALVACGPTYAPANAPSRPCPQVTQSEFEAALASGAARGDARVHASGIVETTFGPGAVHCATFRRRPRTCRRPVDLVMRYAFDGGEPVYVRVPAGSQYRFNVGAEPTTCRIVNEHLPGG